MPYGIDEFHVAGGLRGGAVKLVKCETIDVEVPAMAEVIIEGVTIPGERVADGPYGEYPGCYSDAKQAPVLKVTAITMRQESDLADRAHRHAGDGKPHADRVRQRRGGLS